MMGYQEEKFAVETPDDVTLRGVKYVPENIKAKIFFLHGLSVPKEGPANILTETAASLAQNGFEVVAFDFRGHGTSGGKDHDFTFECGLVDFDTVFNTEQASQPVGVLGFSFGAAIAVDYFVARNTKVAAAVLFSPVLDSGDGLFDNPNSVMGQAYAKMKTDGNDKMTMPNGFHIGAKMAETANNYPAAYNLSKLSDNTLIIQGRNDQMLDFELMQKLGRDQVAKYIVLDTIHGLTEEKDRAIQLTVDWFSKKLMEAK
ncbi:hypothetical protein FACS189431_5410 [Alphaproteobacteria bacterium]|nr:hypothetical protein FACS189431_5410 [Alphaproteobacteria bacterium]